jgi:hypothetical protein
VSRFVHDLEIDLLAVLDPSPAHIVRFEAGIAEVISDEQRRQSARLLCGLLGWSDCRWIGWFRSRRLAARERNQREREPSVTGERNPLASPVCGRSVF